MLLICWQVSISHSQKGSSSSAMCRRGTRAGGKHRWLKVGVVAKQSRFQQMRRSLSLACSIATMTSSDFLNGISRIVNLTSVHRRSNWRMSSEFLKLLICWTFDVYCLCFAISVSSLWVLNKLGLVTRGWCVAQFLLWWYVGQRVLG